MGLAVLKSTVSLCPFIKTVLPLSQALGTLKAEWVPGVLGDFNPKGRIRVSRR
ncbi:MAG: hypothetical protein GXO76_05995 [Calditrichaeota bacterium]|nr:hypothetical protein [Calditrichota bacterium]